VARLVLADEHDLFMLGARQILEQSHHLIVGTFDTKDALLKGIGTLKPDVLCLGDRLDPTFDLLDFLGDIQATQSEFRTLVIGTCLDGLLIRDLFSAGIHGYLYKGDTLADCLGLAICLVLANRPYLSTTANAEYLIAMQTRRYDWQLDAEARAVLRLLADGCTVGSIAARLHIHQRRVYWIREKLRRRFGATTNEHLIRRAVADGFNSLAE
jgi:DNA-binding NarL/FixJ family response regulator